MNVAAKSGVALACLFLPGCQGFGQTELVPGQMDISRLRTMIHDSPCDSVPAPPGGVAAVLTGGVTYENEVHDCQRLVVDTGGRPAYGPLVGLFPLDSAMAASEAYFSGGAIAASIYNWGAADGTPMDYRALGVDDGWQCLWLRWDERRQWQAAITPVEDAPCNRAGHPEPRYGDLEVRELNHVLEGDELAPPEIYPPTARWGWDSVNEQHYMGIKCGQAWCVIGESRRFVPRERDPMRGLVERTVPGWYDEQHLAVHDSTDRARPVLRPGPWGAIYPIPNLPLMTEAQFRAGLYVADIVVATNPADPVGKIYYERRFHLEPGTNDGRVRVWLRVAGSSAGGAVFEQPGTGIRRPTKGFRRMLGTLHAAKGAVRWRWHDNPGETGWIWCDGCCNTGFM